jgi:hypothetical protein
MRRGMESLSSFFEKPEALLQIMIAQTGKCQVFWEVLLMLRGKLLVFRGGTDWAGMPEERSDLWVDSSE